MKKLSRNLSLLSAAALLGLAGLQGCGDDDPVVPDPATGEMIIVHGAAAAPAVDVLVDNGVVASNLVLGDVTDGYLEVEEGTRRIRVTPVGDTTGALIDLTVPIQEGDHFTAFAVTDTNGTADILLFEDDLTAPAAGKALIRIAHLIPDGPHARLGIPGSGTGPIVDSINFKENTNLFQQIDADGSTTFAVANADGGGGSTIPRLVPNFTLDVQEGDIYTIVLIGRISDSSARHVVIKHEHD